MRTTASTTTGAELPSVRLEHLLDSIRCSFVIALNALCQAATNCGIIGLNPTKREITEVIADLRKAIDVIDNYKSNTDISGGTPSAKYDCSQEAGNA